MPLALLTTLSHLFLLPISALPLTNDCHNDFFFGQISVGLVPSRSCKAGVWHS
jgi:hypothetical protein